MLKQTSREFRKFFLLTFTKELIKNSGSREIYELEGILKKERENILKKVRESFEISENKEFKELISISKQNIQQEKIPQSAQLLNRVPQNFNQQQRNKIAGQLMPTIKVAEPRLPPKLQYIQPIPTNVPINLGKLNPLKDNLMIQVIECYGENQEIITSGMMGRKKTSVVLTKEEINNIIKTFSEKTKIPVQEGIFKVALGNLLFTAVVSETTGSRFVIKKIVARPLYKENAR